MDGPDRSFGKLMRLFATRVERRLSRMLGGGMRERNEEILSWNVKALSSLIAREAALKHMGDGPAPTCTAPTQVLSRGCVQSDFHEEWMLYWLGQLGFGRSYHRKLWEHAYVLQTLFSLGLIEAGKSGVGFGVGLEPEPSLMAARGVSVLATDLETSEAQRLGWTATDQHAPSLQRMHRADLATWETFERLVRFREVDMNAIPSDLDGRYDFCWSSCALEHLGSIRKGLDFIKNSLKPLKPGGHAVHTTEYNYMRDELTLDNWPTVLFRRRDLELVAAELTAEGHYVYPFDFDVLKSPLDFLIDVPPYPHEGGAQATDFHLRLAVDGFATTSFGIVVRKAS